MNFFSTRDFKNIVSFKKAVLECLPEDGGLYVPDEGADLRKWILYADEKTSFASLAGSLTSAMISNEFSPLICERIATAAFPNDPVLRKLDDNLYILELYHGATDTFKDFGVAYLASALETILTYDGGKTIFLDATTGELGACMANALKGKQKLKSVLLAPKGKFRGMDESDFVWNGGNVYPVEVDGTEEDCHKIIRKIFEDKNLVKKFNLSVANTANIGRLLPQAFFYTFAFSRLKKVAAGDIYYAFAAGNYGNLVSGLYGWKMALPVNGFIVPSTSCVTADGSGNCIVPDSMIPVENRLHADPTSPSNIERLEQIFKANSLMLKNFVFPAHVTEEDISDACRTLYKKYSVYADRETASAYAAVLKRNDIAGGDDESVVLVARNAPYLDKDFIRHNIGIEPEESENASRVFAHVELNREAIAPDDIDAVISVLSSLM